MYKNRFFPVFFLVAFSVNIVIATVLVFITEIQASAICMECHETMYQQEMIKSHIHEPYRLKKCDICHAAESGWSMEEDITELTKKLRWLARRQVPSTEHWFDFQTSGIEKVLFFEASAGKEVYRKKIVLPELEKIMVLQNDRQPPRITDLKILDVQLGVFVTATIAWKTDRVATCFVTYGVNKVNEFAADIGCLGLNHRITLADLKPNKIYSVQVTSRDIFGNENSSDIIQISTKKDLGADEGVSNRVLQATEQKLSVSHTLYKANDRYLFHIAANRPIKFAVGAIPVIPAKKTKKFDTVQTDLPDDHIKLKGPAESCIYVCYNCHQDYNKISTHPVDVGPKSGMIIPSEYPTLPNGKISCMSCHSPHAKDREFLLLKSSKKALCIGCHKDMA